MKYCLNINRLTKEDKCFNSVEEINIPFNKQDKTLIDFMILHKNQRIILSLTGALDENTFNLFKAIKEEHSEINFAVKINQGLIALKDIKKVNSYFPLFCNIIASNWEIFYLLIEAGVSDIYIGGELGFDLIRAKKIANKHHIKLRAIINHAFEESSLIPALKAFFIRPEDIAVYEQYIDTVEFFCAVEKEPILYRIYAKEKVWSGDLGEIIDGLQGCNLDSRFLLPGFSSKRVTCNRECLKGGKCRKCDLILTLSEKLKDNNMGFQIKDIIDKKE